MKQTLIAVAFMLGTVSVSFAHCQVPCGIYDDELRVKMIRENIVTIEKAMKMIANLSGEEEPNYNQIVRWVKVKDEHADDIAHIVCWYFLQQRLPPAHETDPDDVYQDYRQKLEMLHGILFYSMKAKQTTDLSNVQTLEALLDSLNSAYIGEQ
jgi:nickel superoxide dismutase